MGEQGVDGEGVGVQLGGVDRPGGAGRELAHLFPGEEDPDGDGLTNAEELTRGTLPRNPDSDSDGLADGLETRLDLDPLAADSDQDGIRDGDEDSDGDGLSNNAEIARGSDPVSADTDGDGVGDGDEVAIGTDPKAFTDFVAGEVRRWGRVVRETGATVN